MPKSPGELLQHDCVRYRFRPSGRIAPWSFVEADGNYDVEVGGRLIVNSLLASVNLAKQGIALVYTFSDYCFDDLASGRLISVLEEHLADTPGVYMYFPREYRSMMPLRLLLDHLRESGVADVLPARTERQ